MASSKKKTDKALIVLSDKEGSGSSKESIAKKRERSGLDLTHEGHLRKINVPGRRNAY